MKILILLPKLNAGSELALNRLLREKDIKVVGILRSDVSPFNKRYWKYARYCVRRTGVYYALLIGLFFHLHFIAIAIASCLLWMYRKRRWFTVDELIQKHRLPVFDTTNVNDDATKNFIRKINPDLMASIYFDQILDRETIDIPRKGTINLHPGILPRYKGIWAFFWKIFNREKKGGVTIHFMNEKIDEGRIIALETFRIKKAETPWGLRLSASLKGVKLLIDVLKKMKAGTKFRTIRSRGLARYYSLPTKEHLDAFFSDGKKLFTIRSFLKDIGRLF